MKIEAYGFVKEGKLNLLGRKRFDADIKAMKDCDVQIIVKRKGKRSLPSNKYYWGCALPEIRTELIRIGQIRKDVSCEDLHEAFKMKFNPENIKDENSGEVLLEVGGSTAAMNQDEFSAYMDRVIYWAANSLGLTIPPPCTQTEMFHEPNYKRA